MKAGNDYLGGVSSFLWDDWLDKAKKKLLEGSKVLGKPWSEGGKTFEDVCKLAEKSLLKQGVAKRVQTWLKGAREDRTVELS